MQKNDLFGGTDSFNEGRRLPSSGGVASPPLWPFLKRPPGSSCTNTAGLMLISLTLETSLRLYSWLALNLHVHPVSVALAVTHRSAACSRADGQLLPHFW